MAAEVVPLPKKKSARTQDVVADAYARGAPTPLAVMLANLEFWHNLATELHASGDPENAILSRMARMQSQRCAVDCAQYVHPRLASTVSMIDIEHHHHSAPPSPFAALSDEACERLLSRIEAGEISIQEVLRELG